LAAPKAGVALKKAVLWFANLTFDSGLLLVATFVLMTTQLAKANGGQLPAARAEVLAAGVLGLDGWANRLIVALYCVWVFVVARQPIRLRR
jgi:hypothetical protein